MTYKSALKLIEAIRANQVYVTDEVVHSADARISTLIEEKDAAIARADRLEAALKSLIEHCEITRDTAGYWKSQTTHQINPTQWKSWCKQIKFARATLAELQGEQQ